ncbi:MAG: hypothetical protein ACK6BZ_15450 [Candidatus Kapaibacterium sp.]
MGGFIEHKFYKRIIPAGLNPPLNFIPSIGGVSEGRGGFSLRGGRRSLTGWIYPKPRPAFFAFPVGEGWDGAKNQNAS